MLKQLKLNQKAGFTLVELMIALAIAGILMYYAMPAYDQFSKRQALTNQTNSLLGDLRFARTLAIDNGSLVTVTSASGDVDWSDGWNISETLADGTTQIMRTQIELPKNISMTATSTTVIYNSIGALSTAVMVNFTVEITPGFANFITVSVLPSGLASSNRTL